MFSSAASFSRYNDDPFVVLCGECPLVPLEEREREVVIFFPSEQGGYLIDVGGRGDHLHILPVLCGASVYHLCTAAVHCCVNALDAHLSLPLS